VEVYPGCSGVDAIVHLLSLSLLFFLLFPSDLKTKILLPLAAITIGFVANGIRVSLLAVIVALHEGKGFEYWHAGEGSLIFSMISAALRRCAIFGSASLTTRHPQTSRKR
jgi:cyanoexosortase A